MTEPVYDFVCSLGELIDKLSIENVKCHFFNTQIMSERQKLFPDTAKISELEGNARSAGEQRVRLRDEINRRLAEAIQRGSIGSTRDARTYGLEK